MLQRQAWLLDVPWQLAVIYEAQAIKNPAAGQTKAVKRLKAQTRIALTGTPVENRLSDLWSLFDFLCPGLLGSQNKFKDFIKVLNAREQQPVQIIQRMEVGADSAKILGEAIASNMPQQLAPVVNVAPAAVTVEAAHVEIPPANVIVNAVRYIIEETEHLRRVAFGFLNLSGVCFRWDLVTKQSKLTLKLLQTQLASFYAKLQLV
jgi:hypothetical protein